MDAEITWHDERRLREAEERGEEAADDDHFTEIFTEFYNWASERKENFDSDHLTAVAEFRGACALLGEEEAKEPHQLFDTLEKFIRRFEAVSREV